MDDRFPKEGMELTHILVVGDIERAKDFYRDVLSATIYREYGGRRESCSFWEAGSFW